MPDSFVAALTEALAQNGIPAYPEYPQVLAPLPECSFFVTLAVSEIQLGTPYPAADGSRMPAEITLRVRYLWRTDADIAMHTDDADSCIMQHLRRMNCDLRGIRRGALQYQKALGRMERETLFSLRGIIFDTGGDV